MGSLVPLELSQYRCQRSTETASSYRCTVWIDFYQLGYLNSNVLNVPKPIKYYNFEISCTPIKLPPPSESSPEGTPAGPLSVLEVSDPKLCILAHLMSPLEPLDPVLESPLSHPLMKQRAVASELLNEVQQANTAVGGMLLANMERNGIKWLYISFWLNAKARR